MKTRKRKVANQSHRDREANAARGKHVSFESILQFYLLVESVYFTNFSIKIIRAYADREIMDVILGGILKNKHMECKFCLLYADDVGTKEQHKIIKYLMESYAKIRGTFLLSVSKTTILKAPLTH